jgi:hypothetical protein
MPHRAAGRAANPADWSIEDAKACVDNLRAFDAIMHRYGMCPTVDDLELVNLCFVCSDKRDRVDGSL